MKIDLIGPAYTSRSKVIDYQECVNWYPEIEQPNSKNVIALLPTPGLTLFADGTDEGACRGTYTTSTGRLYKVSGNQVKEVTVAGTQMTVGTISTISGPVSMADNGIELIIVDGLYGYIVTLLTNALVQITTFDDLTTPWPGSSHVVFIAGYFVCLWRGQRGQFMWSNSYDGATWDATHYAVAESSPDDLLAITKANNELWFIGSQTTECWYLSGDSDLPFTRVSSSIIDVGTAAKHSCATNGSQVLWLGSNASGHGSVWMAAGYQPQRVSTHAIEYVIGTAPRLDDAIGYCYQQEGHRYYILSFQTTNRTLVYDISNGLWHEMASFNETEGINQRHRGICHAFFNQKNYVGDYANGNIYELSLNVFTDNGVSIVRERTSSHINSENKKLFFGSVELEMERGVGLTSGQGSDPQIMLSWSDDGGMTFGNERWGTAGALGNYKTRIRWNRCGSSRDRIFKVKTSDPVKMILVDCYASVGAE